MFSISARLDAQLSPDDILHTFGLEKGGRVQQVIDQTVIDFCTEGGYVPAGPNRTLEFSAQASTEIGSGEVIWNTPYAHYQYMGIVYGPNIPVLQDGILMGWFSPPGRPKSPTDRELTYDTSYNERAGPHWFERMKADRLNDILDTARRAMVMGE